MLKRTIIFSLFLVAINLIYAQQTVLYPGITGKRLRDSLVINYKPINVLSYDTARDTLYGKVDLRNGYVHCTYSGDSIPINPSSGVAPRTQAFNLGYSTEHGYPQSKGASTGNGNSNMHHLFPVRQDVNSSRNNLPYMDVPDAAVTKWWRFDTSQTTIPAALKGEYSKCSNSGFEVRDVSKGNVARATFYFFTMYQNEAENADPDFFNTELNYVRRWHSFDPPDALEYTRNNKMALDQSNKINPFVIDTTLVKRAYSINPPKSFTLTVLDQKHVQLSWIKNDNNDKVLIVRNQTGVIDDPADGISYLNGQPGLNGYILISDLNSIIDSVPQLGLYYYKIYSLTDTISYSVGLFRSVSTGITNAIHYWNFNNNVPATGQQWPNSITADSSNGLLTHNFPDVESFAGTVLNGENNEVAGGSFSPKGTANNDFSMVFSVPTVFFKDIIFSYASKGTASGYNDQSIFYSTDGANFDSLTCYLASGFDWIIRAVDFSNIPYVNNNPLFKIKIIIRGATSIYGNNRFDNIKVIGNQYSGIKNYENPLENVEIYPNPAKDYLNIAFNHDIKQNMRIEIFSNAGIKLYNRDLNQGFQNNSLTLNTEILAPGLYILKIQTPFHYIFRKFVVYR